jgi:hypothetical protein
MARSVLPSTARHGVRADLDATRRRYRRRVRGALRQVQPTCSCVDVPGTVAVGCGRCDVDIHVDYPLSAHLGIDAARRRADKVAPLVRWGRVQVGDLDGDTALARLRSMLPPGVIGAHAVSHLVWAGVVDDGRRAWWPARPGRRPVVARTERLEALARWALVTGRHGELNRRCPEVLVAAASDPGVSAADDRTVVEATARFRARAGDDPAVTFRDLRGCRWARRPLAGAHDVDAWAATVDHLRFPVSGLVAWASAQGWADPACAAGVRRM